MNEKFLFIAILSLLGIAVVAILVIMVPWFFERGFSNWRQVLIDDGLIVVAIAAFVYGLYMNTKLH